MLPAVGEAKQASQYVDDTKMRSRVGKKTQYDFAILKEVDPTQLISKHRKIIAQLEKNGPLGLRDPPPLRVEKQEDQERDER